MYILTICHVCDPRTTQVTAVLKCYFDLSPIDTVPPVLMEHVFSYLHITKHHDLCAVCSEWDQYASGDVLWREIYFQRFKTFDHEEPLAPAALAPAAAATAEGGEGAAGEDAAPAAAAAAAAVGNGASAGGGGAGTVGGIPAASAAARGGSTTAAPTTPVRSSASSGAGSGGSNSADSDSGGGVTKSGNGPTTSSASSSSTLPFGEPPPRTPPPTSTASAANVATRAATATPTTPTASTPNELPSSEQQRTPPPSSSRYPSFVVTPPPLYIGSSSGGGGGSTGSGVSRTRSVYSGGASESSPALDSSPAALSAILRRQSSGGDTVNTHGFKALFYRRLLDPWIGDHVEVLHVIVHLECICKRTTCSPCTISEHALIAPCTIFSLFLFARTIGQFNHFILMCAHSISSFFSSLTILLSSFCLNAPFLSLYTGGLAGQV